MREHALRTTGPLMTINERVLWATLIDATISWGRLTRALTDDHLVDGLEGRVQGCHLSHGSLTRAKRGLEAKGFISTKRGRDGIMYTISDPEEWTKVPEYPTPRAKKQKAEQRSTIWDRDGDDAGEIATSGQSSLPRDGNQDCPEEAVKIAHTEVLEDNTVPDTEPTTTTGEAAGGVVGVRDQVEEIQARSAAKRKARVARPTKVTVPALEDVWRGAIVDTFKAVAFELNTARWTGPERGMVKNLIKEFASAEAWGEVTDFVDFAAREYRRTCRVKLDWMTKEPPPDFPKIRFVYALRSHFISEWCERRIRRLIHEPGLDKIERAEAQGMSYLEAVAHVAIEEHEVTHREKFDDERRALALLQEAVTKDRERLGRVGAGVRQNTRPGQPGYVRPRVKSIRELENDT
jgi:hypothetical protein